MGTWAAFLRFLDAARESAHALAAAEAVLRAGGSPLAALRAFAAATPGALDDEALAALEAALVHALHALDAAVTTLAWIAAAETPFRAALDRGVGALVDAGYAAGRVRLVLRRWLDEASP